VVSEHRLNPTAGSLLGFLHYGTMTGWAVSQLASSTIGAFWNVTRSQVYRELNDLEARGLVTAGEPGARGRTPYTLTDAGRAAFGAWLDTEPGPDIIRSPLLLTVFFGAELPPERFAAMVESQRRRHEGILDRYETVRTAVDPDDQPFMAATLRFGIMHERTILEWLDSLETLAERRGRKADAR
jgi:DNA-binding PadR family transcriptional regulator